MMQRSRKNGFYDLCVNVPVDDLEKLKEVLQRLYEFGFGTVAINYNVEENVFGAERRKKKKKGEENEAPQSSLPEPVEVEKLAQEFKDKLVIVSRITFHCTDPSKTHALAHCASLKKYNLYAIAPKTQNVLQFACSQLNADIITLLPTVSGLKMNKKLYDQAVERGMHFEIRYADVLDLETRKMAIHFSHLFHTYGKSKNVILTSGAVGPTTIRNPYDLINLSSLFGLNEVKSKAAILRQCKTLLLKAEKRRRGKAIFAIEEMKSVDLESEELESAAKRIKL